MSTPYELLASAAQAASGTGAAVDTSASAVGRLAATHAGPHAWPSDCTWRGAGAIALDNFARFRWDGSQPFGTLSCALTAIP
jgi:hypothetical protein